MKSRFHEQAADDLDEDVRYYNDASPGLGLQFLAEARAAVEYLEDTDDIGNPAGAFTVGLLQHIDGDRPTQRAAAIIAARKFGVREGVLPGLIAALYDQRSVGRHAISALIGPTVGHQAAITINELGLRESLPLLDHAKFQALAAEVARNGKDIRI